MLDVCCGSGASALPAAEVVGPGGRVLGIDLAEKLLALARRKAADRGLRQVEFRARDMLDLDLRASSFDAVVCVFGIFFVPDMAAAVRALWRVVRPGGRLAITTWEPRFFEPVTSDFWSAVRRERPELDRGFNPWDRLCEPAALRALLREGGVEDAQIVAKAGAHPIPSADAWWAGVLGSGYRGTVDQLDPAARERVRAANAEFIRRHDVREVEANVVYSIAIKPPAT